MNIKEQYLMANIIILFISSLNNETIINDLFKDINVDYLARS